VTRIDPRGAGVHRRLEPVGRILAVTGGKGGIGKSLVASTLALGLAAEGRRAGLVDLDLTGPCDHLFLGLDEGIPSEEFGVEPAVVHGVHFMSVACFAGQDAAPLRGAQVSDALIELLAITHWPELDVLVVDMPPGLGDVALDAVHWLDGAAYVVVATPSRVVLDTVRRTLDLHRRLGSHLAGLVENMGRGEDGPVRTLAVEYEAAFLGSVPWDEGVEAAIGAPERLADTEAARAVRGIARKLVGPAD
jgi:ATP-binding protein involved in chromosome partitioning